MQEIKIKSYDELTLTHPCFATGKKSHKGRIHLPVSPGCNIECRFCERSINDYEEAPGVTASVITPQEAVDAVRRALALCPDITVAGIAGPGDTLATPYALEAFGYIKAEFPQIIACMSTNGLLLDEKADAVIAAGIDSLTVTVNAVKPEIQAQINDGIRYHGRHITGIEAAEILIANQLSGIRKIAAAGITVKVNTVLIAGVNDDHIEEVARTVSEAGAKIYNLIPLIPRAKFSDASVLTCAQIDGARAKAEPYIDVFRHCQHCRADAVGVPGESEFGDKIYLRRVEAKDTFSHG
ncbi:MAG: radical SAM protein [Oscillospiraceae bacterium]